MAGKQVANYSKDTTKSPKTTALNFLGFLKRFRVSKTVCWSKYCLFHRKLTHKSPFETLEKSGKTHQKPHALFFQRWVPALFENSAASFQKKGPSQVGPMYNFAFRLTAVCRNKRWTATTGRMCWLQSTAHSKAGWLSVGFGYGMGTRGPTPPSFFVGFPMTKLSHWSNLNMKQIVNKSCKMGGFTSYKVGVSYNFTCTW